MRMRKLFERTRPHAPCSRLLRDRAAYPPLEGEGRPPQQSGGGRGGVKSQAALRVHPTPLAALATPLQGRVDLRRKPSKQLTSTRAVTPDACGYSSRTFFEKS